MPRIAVAVDIGAGSGRVIVGEYEGGDLKLDEVHRFTHDISIMNGSYFWDFPLIWNEVSKGIKKAHLKYGKIDSIGVDAFAPDFCLLNRNNEIIGPAKSYRNFTDGRHRLRAVEKYPERRFLEKTGNCAIDIGLLSQLISLKDTYSSFIENGAYILPIPNLICFLLGGDPCTDFTQSSISMMNDWRKNTWDKRILEIFGIPESLLPIVKKSPAIIGECRLEGLENTKIINVGSHDTAVANYMLSAISEDAICLNTGTWTSVGVKVNKPNISEDAIKMGLSNFGLPDESYILCKNIIGLWYLQEIKKCWNKEDNGIGFKEISEMAKSVLEMPVKLDLLSERYLKAFDMLPEVISKDLKEKLGRVPTNSEIVRTVYDFLVCHFDNVIKQIESITKKKYESLIIGGGALQDDYLCSYIEGKIRKKLIRGPVEAASTGNVFLQLVAMGELFDKEKQEEFVRGIRG